MRSRSREVGVNEKDSCSLNLTEPFIHSFTQRPECVEGFTERTVSLKEFTQCIHSISFHRTQNTVHTFGLPLAPCFAPAALGGVSGPCRPTRARNLVLPGRHGQPSMPAFCSTSCDASRVFSHFSRRALTCRDRVHVYPCGQESVVLCLQHE